MTGREEIADGTRAVVYCLLPRDLAPLLHDALRRHFSLNPEVEVIVERRDGERRRASDRRMAADQSSTNERRVVRSRSGRRVGERRAALIEVGVPVLPRRARRFADQIVFAERLEPSTQRLEDLDSARTVLRIQAGERDLFAVLYARYFDRVYSYMRALLRDPTEAEDATQHVFLSTFEALPRYELREQPFRAWLFTIVRNRALKHIERGRRLELVDSASVAELQDAGAAPFDADVLDWLTDRELTMFVERLPLLQRQVLLLRYLFDLPAPQVAQILGRSPTYVRKLEERALGFLRVRLMALGRAPHCEGRREVRGVLRQARVLRARRWAMMP
jgi:RNA polymerase sigma-70 factor (ECF subfamily)